MIFIPTVDGSGLEFTNPNQWPWAERESQVMNTIQDMISSHPNIEKNNKGKRKGARKIKINRFFATASSAFSLFFHQICGEKILIYFIYLLIPPHASNEITSWPMWMEIIIFGAVPWCFDTPPAILSTSRATGGID